MTRARRLKGWPGWALLSIVVVALLVVGGTRDNGPSTPEERVTAISEKVACPNCEGESVAASRDASSELLRNEIRRLVDAGRLSDDEIITSIEQGGDRLLLLPKNEGFDALVWALPVAALVCAIAGLAFTFRRWRREAAEDEDPTDDDRELVAAALADDAADDGT